MASYGTSIVAIYGACVKVMHFGVMAIAGLGLGTGALIGQYLGSQERHKAWLAAILSIRLAGWIMLGYAAVLLISAPHLVRSFFPEPEMHEPGIAILRIMAFALPFIGIHIGSEIVFEGAGQNTPPMILALVHGKKVEGKRRVSRWVEDGPLAADRCLDDNWLNHVCLLRPNVSVQPPEWVGCN